MSALIPEAAERAIAALAIAKSLGLDKAGADFLKTIFSEPAKDLGEILAHFSTRRFKNFLKVNQRSQEMIADAGETPRSVPLRLLQPIIDGASNEEAEDMQERWAALLANAARRGDSIAPLYPRILGQLSPVSANTLDKICSRHLDRAVTFRFWDVLDAWPEWPTLLQRVATDKGATETPADSDQPIDPVHASQTMRTILSELAALGLLEVTPETDRLVQSGGASSWRLEVGAPYQNLMPPLYQVSPLGKAFIAALSPPGRQPGSEDLS